jgi:hypothetical protein
MKILMNFSVILLTFLIVVTTVLGQDPATYQHPALNFEVQAFEDWVEVPHPEDELIFEIADPESVLRVKMWRVETESTGSDFLKTMADKNKLVYDGEPTLGKINNRDAWVLDATCCMKKAPVRVVLIAIPNNQEDQSLYIGQVLCPEGRLDEKENSMEGIIYSLQITD